MTVHPGDAPIPTQLRAASAVVVVQALALLGAVVLVSCARGLLAQRPAARTPVVVLELLALPVSYSLGFQAGLLAYGVPIMFSALAVLYLLFTPAARAVLDRDPEH